MPERIQLRRTKGWRKPEGVIVVDRRSKWGNPFRLGELVPEGDPIECQHRATRQDVVESFENAVYGHFIGGPLFSTDELEELRGKDLACWCKPSQWCHADVLLEIANLPADPKEPTK